MDDKFIVADGSAEFPADLPAKAATCLHEVPQSKHQGGEDEGADDEDGGQ